MKLYVFALIVAAVAFALAKGVAEQNETCENLRKKFGQYNNEDDGCRFFCYTKKTSGVCVNGICECQSYYED